jgi:hypothetical protein
MGSRHHTRITTNPAPVPILVRFISDLPSG